VKPIGLRL